MIEPISTTLAVTEAAEAVEQTVEKAVEISNAIREAGDQLAKEMINQDGLVLTDKQIDGLLRKAVGVERAAAERELSFKGIKICATRHGCTGATNCDSCMSGPIGR